MPRLVFQVVAWLMLVVQLGFGLMPAGLVVCFDMPRDAEGECAAADKSEASDPCCEPGTLGLAGFPVLMDETCPVGCGCCVDVLIPDTAAVITAAPVLDHVFSYAPLPIADVAVDLWSLLSASDAAPRPWPPIPKRAEIGIAIARGLDSTLLLI